MKTIKLKQDYYGNQDYGKRAFWILDNEGNQSFEFVFFHELKEWVEKKQNQGYEFEIEYDVNEKPLDKWLPNIN